MLLAGLFLTFLYITFTIKDYKGEAEDEDDEDGEEEEYDETVKLLGKKDIFHASMRWWIGAEVGHSFERMQVA